MPRLQVRVKEKLYSDSKGIRKVSGYEIQYRIIYFGLTWFTMYRKLREYGEDIKRNDPVHYTKKCEAIDRAKRVVINEKRRQNAKDRNKGKSKVVWTNDKKKSGYISFKT